MKNLVGFVGWLEVGVLFSHESVDCSKHWLSFFGSRALEDVFNLPVINHQKCLIQDK